MLQRHYKQLLEELSKMRPPPDLEEMEVEDVATDTPTPTQLPNQDAPPSQAPPPAPICSQSEPAPPTTTIHPLYNHYPATASSEVGAVQNNMDNGVEPFCLCDDFVDPLVGGTSSDTSSGSSSEEQGTVDSSEDQGGLSSAPEDMVTGMTDGAQPGAVAKGGPSVLNGTS